MRGAVTSKMRVAIIVSSGPVRYRSSYLPAATGASKTSGRPNADTLATMIAGEFAGRFGAMTIRSFAPPGPVQATVNVAPPTISAGASIVAVGFVTSTGAVAMTAPVAAER